MLAVLLVIILVSTSSGSNRHLNTFKVAPSTSQHEETNCCGGPNVTFSVGCGITPRVNARNIPPLVAAFGEFPWQVAIVDAYEQSFLCSGVLLSHKTVLTAAHCVADVPTSDLRVRLGEWDILSDEDPRETYRSLELAVSKKYFHPDMEISSDRMSEFHSVSLLKLRSHVNFGLYPHVLPACLPAPPSQGEPTLEQQLTSMRCFVAGWSESPLSQLQSMEGSAVQKRRDVASEGESNSERKTRLPADTTTTKPCLGSSCDDSACYATDSPRQQRGKRDSRNCRRASSSRSHVDDDISVEHEAEPTWSRILGKAQTFVVPRDECMTLTNDAIDLEASSLCLFPREGHSSHPCQGDIGAAVVCEMPVSNSGKRIKPGREREEIATRLDVVGVITRSFSCGDVRAEGKGDEPIQEHERQPVIATSILRVLDHVCRVAGATKK